MHEIVKLGEQFQARMLDEVEVMQVERTMMRDVAVARGRELQTRREEEIRRIERWAETQKQVVKEVFSAMVAENDADIEKHETALRRLSGPNVAADTASTTNRRFKQTLPVAAE